METAFQDIRITGLDANKSHNFPSQDGTHRIYLTLSAVPPAIWRDIFEREHRTPRSGIWRRATVEDGCIVIICTPEELEKYHLDALKKDVKNTNEKFKLSIQENQDEEARFRQSEEDRKKRLEDLGNRLKFD